MPGAFRDRSHHTTKGILLYRTVGSRRLIILCDSGNATSLADDLNQHSFASSPVEFAIEDLLPRAEVELPARDRHHHLAPHHLSLQVRVPVVLPRPVVEVL